MPRKTPAALHADLAALLTDSGAAGRITPALHRAFLTDVLDTFLLGASNNEVLAFDGSTNSPVWRDVELGMLAAVVREGLLDGVSRSGRTLTFDWLDPAKSDTAITIPLPTGAELVTALTGLSGSARLPYSAVRDGPQLPAYSTANNDQVLKVVSGALAWAADLQGSGGGLTAQQASALIATWALRTGASGTIPAGVLDAGVLRDRLASLAGTARLALSALNFTGTAAQIVRGDGSITALPAELPAVSTANNGAVLKVANGLWAIGIDETASGGGGLTTQQATNLIATWARATSPSGQVPQARLSGAALVAVLTALTGGNRLALGALRDVPPSATQGEITAGTATQARFFSPAQVAEMAEEHGQQADWTESDTSNAAYIQNKPTIPAAPPNASASRRGIVELATAAEARVGSDAVRALTPAALAGVIPAATPSNRSASATMRKVLARSATGETYELVEIGIGTTPATPHTETRYIGIATGTTITDAALTTGATSTSDTDDTFNAPTWASGYRYLYFAVPSDTGDITGVNQTGAQLGNVPIQRIAGTRTIGGVSLKVWRSVDSWPQAFGGAELTITQSS